MAWLYLFVAGLFEVAWAIGLKYTEGFSRLVPSLFTVAAMILSLALLGLALKTLPVGSKASPRGKLKRFMAAPGVSCAPSVTYFVQVAPFLR